MITGKVIKAMLVSLDQFTYRPTIMSSASVLRGRMSLQISTVKMVEEELKILVKLETKDAIITANMRPRAPEGSRFKTSEG